MYETVPSVVPVRVISEEGPASFARPKSRILAVPSAVTIRFAGLISRWTMPDLCASDKACATWMPMSTTSSIGRQPPSSRWRSVCPS